MWADWRYHYLVVDIESDTKPGLVADLGSKSMNIAFPTLFASLVPIKMKQPTLCGPHFRILILGAMSLSMIPIMAKGQTTILVPSDQPTIQKAIDAASDGNTILVSPGTYRENIDFEGKSITVTSGATAFSAAASWILTGSGSGPVVSFQTHESRAAVLNGFTILNAPTTGIYLQGSSPTLRNNVVEAAGACGVAVEGPNASPLLEGNKITGTRSVTACDGPDIDYLPSPQGTPGTGLLLYGAGDVEVIDNTVEHSATYEVLAQDASANTTLLFENNTVRNDGLGSGALFLNSLKQTLLIQNSIYGNESNAQTDNFTSSPIQIFTAVPSLAPGTPRNFAFIMANNTIDWGLAKDFIFQTGGNFAPFVVENNILIGNTNTISCSIDNSYPVTFRNNDVLNTDGSAPAACGSNEAGMSNLNVDPEFIDAVLPDFHTQRSSPVVAAGDIDAPDIPPADLDGKNRTVCGKIDMGVYQVHPQPPIALTSSPNPSVGGSDVTFTATLTGNCNVPTGVVSILDGTAVLGTATISPGSTVNGVASGVATFDTSALTVGSHTMTATYAGDFNFDASTSNVAMQVVTGYPTVTTLTVSPNPAAAFQTITLRSEVTSQFGFPGGTVAFFAGTTLLTNATVDSNGVATATINTLGAGSYNLSAVYQATTNFATSRSPVVAEVVNGSPTATVLTSSLNPSAFAQSVTFTAKVAATGAAGTPAGTVSFLDGTVVLTAVPNTGDGVSFRTSSLAVGNHPVTAVYAGSGDYEPSTSNTVVQVVSLVGTSVGLSATPNPANFGQTVTLTAAVATNAGGVPAAPGSVVFADQVGVLGSAAIVNGAATFTTSSLAIGTHTLTASYAGAAGYAGAISAAVAEVIQSYDFAVSVTPGSVTVPSGDYAVLRLSVSPIGGYKGTVALSCSGVPVDAQCVFQPGATVSLAAGAVDASMVFDTSQLFESGTQVGSLAGQRRPVIAMVFLPMLALLGGLRRRKLLALAMLIGVLGVQGCSGKLPGSTPPGSYAVTITANDASSGLTHVAALVVRVK